MMLWFLIGWPTLNVAFVLQRHFVTRARKADAQAVYDAFDGVRQ